jgi:hypothetical protein
MAWRLSSSSQGYQLALYYQLLTHRSGAGTPLKAAGARITCVRWLQQTQSLRHAHLKVSANLATIPLLPLPLRHKLAHPRFTVMPTSTAIVSAPRPLQISALLTYRIQARALSTRQSVTTRWGRRLRNPHFLCWAAFRQADVLHHHHCHLQLNVSLTLACHQVPQVAPQVVR